MLTFTLFKYLNSIQFFFEVDEAEIGVERVENKFYVKSKYLDNENVHRTPKIRYFHKHVV